MTSDDGIDKLIEELGVPVMPNTRGRVQAVSSAEAQFNQLADKIESHNPAMSQVAVLKESPEHTLALWMRASGSTREQVCARLGWNKTYFGQLEKQAWYRIRYEQILRDCGQDQVEHFLTGVVVPCLTTLESIAQDPKEKGSVRVAAINSLLDRGPLGKPTIRIETRQLEPSATDATNEVERLRAESAELARQLAANGVSTSAN